MSSQLLASKIVIEEEEPRVRAVTEVPTAVLGIVGITERGPFEVTQITSPAEYQRIFGGYTASGKVKQAMDGWFLNGGVEVWVKRTVHYTDIDDVDSKTSTSATLNLQTATGSPYAGTVTCSETETYELSPADDLDISIDGGGTQTVTFDAAAASVESGNSETYDLADGLTLTVKVDQGSVQTVIFNTAEFSDIANATAEEVAAVINAELTGASATASSGGTKVTITSDTEGTGSYVEVTGGTANTGGSNRLNFSTSEVQGTGDVVDISVVTATEAASLINADTTGCVASVVSGAVKITSDTTGASSSVQIESSSTADTNFGFDNATHYGGTGAAVNTLQVDAKTDGTWANGVTIQVAAATSGESDEFNLSVLVSGVVVEVWPNLSMTDGDENFVETLVNHETTGSDYIVVTDLDAAPPSPQDLPAVGTQGPLTGGGDGLSGLVDADFVGSSVEAPGTGLRGLDSVQNLSLLICPDRPTSAVHNAMLTYCETTRDKAVFAILDPPEDYTASEIITYVTSTASLYNLSEFGAIYWPWVKVLNPSAAVFGSSSQITVPPSGHIAGVFARTDGASTGGVYQPPAGVERGILSGVLGFASETVLQMAYRDLLYPKRINPLTTAPGLPRYIDGTRTLKGNGNFPSVAERRGAIFIEQSVKSSLEFARHSNNDEALRAVVARTVRAFLLRQMYAGAFRSRVPDQAFFIDFGVGLNPPSVQFAGQLIGRIGIATQKPADFVILRFSQDTRALEEEIATA